MLPIPCALSGVSAPNPSRALRHLRSQSLARAPFACPAKSPLNPPAFTVKPGDYRLMQEVGYGAHAVVYRGVFVPRNEVVAVKCLDLIDEIQREAQNNDLDRSLQCHQGLLLICCGAQPLGGNAIHVYT